MSVIYFNTTIHGNYVFYKMFIEFITYFTLRKVKSTVKSRYIILIYFVGIKTEALPSPKQMTYPKMKCNPIVLDETG